tara:strand:+ start:2013 stop:2651 length:639 start_codon:yes stop_codon:yes gene_type:complete
MYVKKANYLRLTHAVEHEIEIKNSRFIASLAPATDAADIARHVAEVKQRWTKANHYCTASIIGSPFDDTCYASSDDGEPGGTAGRPMLNVLTHHPLGEVSAVVVRYFGGIKLGTGGLQRAYSQAVAEALPFIKTAERKYREYFSLVYDYADQGAVEGILSGFEYKVVEQTFTENVHQMIAIEPEYRAQLDKQFQAQTQGRVKLLEEHRAGLE